MHIERNRLIKKRKDGKTAAAVAATVLDSHTVYKPEWKNLSGNKKKKKKKKKKTVAAGADYN